MIPSLCHADYGNKTIDIRRICCYISLMSFAQNPW